MVKTSHGYSPREVTFVVVIVVTGKPINFKYVNLTVKNLIKKKNPQTNRVP